jgi:type II secretory pathway component PulC
MINKIKDFVKKLGKKKKPIDSFGEDQLGDATEIYSPEIETESFEENIEKTEVMSPRARAEQTRATEKQIERNESDPESTKVISSSDFESRTFDNYQPPKSFGDKLKKSLSHTFTTLWTKSGASKKDWGAIADKILSRESRTNINRFFLVSLLFLISYFSAKTLALFLRGKPSIESVKVSTPNENVAQFDMTTLNQVKAANPFKTNLTTGPKAVANVRCDEADQKTNLPLKLVNTVVLQDEVKSIASVQVRSDRELKEFRVGDEIDNMAKIFKIQRLYMVVKNLESGACEFIENDTVRELRKNISVMSPAASKAYKDQNKKMQGIENVGNKFTVSKKLLAEKMKDIHSILTQAEAIKIQNPDGSLSFKIVNIEPGSIFSFLGIQNQDIITSINGRPISDINEVMNVFGKLSSMQALKMNVKREGEDTPLDYTMK